MTSATFAVPVERMHSCHWGVVAAVRLARIELWLW
jgi:hypothetical protein